MFCRFCGQKLPDGSAFCTKCGKKQEWGENSGDAKEKYIASFDDELQEIGISVEDDEDLDDEDLDDEDFEDDSEDSDDDFEFAGNEADTAYDKFRFIRENGKANTQMYFSDTTYCCLIGTGNQGLLRRWLNEEDNKCFGIEQMIPGPISSFIWAEKNGYVFTTPDGALYIRTVYGQQQKILGGNSDQTAAYCVSGDKLFVLLQGKNDVRILYQLDMEQKEPPKIIKSQVRIKPSMSADENYLYYIIQDPSNVNRSTLMQYDIASGTEKAIFNSAGIREIICYRSYVMISTYSNFASNTQGVGLHLIDPRLMQIRKLADVAAEQLNCYLDHIFYVDAATKKLWMAPLGGGTAHLIWDKPVMHFELGLATVFIWGPNDTDPYTMTLMGENAFQQDSQRMSMEERESLKYNAILYQKPEAYAGLSLDQALDRVMIDFDFDEEIFDYVVFLTKPQFNKRKEDINALLAAANYPAQRKPNSTPILFVDGSLFHGRSKGFVVATDGIYTKSKGFMLFDQTFTCEQKGMQNLDACLWRVNRYDEYPLRTLKLDVAMTAKKVDQVAGLVELVYAFSYFHKAPLKVDYIFPYPPKEVPPYI